MVERDKRFNPNASNPQTRDEAAQVFDSIARHLEREFAVIQTGIMQALKGMVFERLKRHESYENVTYFSFTPGEDVLSELERIVQDVRDKKITSEDAFGARMNPLADRVAEVMLSFDKHASPMGTPEQMAQMDSAVTHLLSVLNTVCPRELLSRLGYTELYYLCNGYMLAEEPVASVMKITDPAFVSALQRVWAASKNCLDRVPTVVFDSATHKLMLAKEKLS
jgi:hypothetical protein